MLAFLAVNPLLLAVAGPVVTSWVLLLEFIFTLAMALKCYPLLPGGLLALEAIALGLAAPATVYREVKAGLPVILLVVFMVAGVHFLRDFLFLIVSRLLLAFSSRMALALAMLLVMAFASAFLDALTILAVLITSMGGFYEVYHRIASERGQGGDHDVQNDEHTCAPRIALNSSSSARSCARSSCTRPSAPRLAACVRWSASRKT